MPGDSEGTAKVAPSAHRENVRHLVYGERLRPYPIETRDAAIRALQHWGDLNWPETLDPASFMEAVYAHEAAFAAGPWDEMTQRERDEWTRKFESTCDALVSLMAQAPRSPAEWGFPVRDEFLMHSLNSAGYFVPENDSGDYFREMLRLEHAFDESGLTIVHALNHYRKQVLVDAGPPQLLKKPRDKDAIRARFIRHLSRYTHLTVAVIAGLTESMLQVEADERVIRRLSK
jgi:hypothetical protein